MISSCNNYVKLRNALFALIYELRIGSHLCRWMNVMYYIGKGIIPGSVYLKLTQSVTFVHSVFMSLFVHYSTEWLVSIIVY